MDKAIDPKVAEGLTAAWRARAVLGARAGARGADRRRGRRGRARAVLPLPVRAAEPDQLERRALRVRGDADRQRRSCWSTTTGATCAASSPARAARSSAGWAHNLSPSYRFQYQTTSAGSRKNVDSAEYANITLHFISWYEQALRAGMRPLPDGRHAAAARVGGARAVRLLDAQRHAQLGQRARLQALDEGQDVGLRAAGADGDRELAALLAGPAARARGPSTSSTAGCGSSRSAASRSPRATSRPCTSTTSAASTRAPAAGGSTSPAWAPTRCARSSAGSGRWTPSRRRRSTPSTPTSAA